NRVGKFGVAVKRKRGDSNVRGEVVVRGGSAGRAREPRPPPANKSSDHDGLLCEWRFDLEVARRYDGRRGGLTGGLWNQRLCHKPFALASAAGRFGECRYSIALASERTLDSQTSATLIGRLQQFPPDQSAWSVFAERYGRRIYGWCRQWNLQEA